MNATSHTVTNRPSLERSTMTTMSSGRTTRRPNQTIVRKLASNRLLRSARDLATRPIYRLTPPAQLRTPPVAGLDQREQVGLPVVLVLLLGQADEQHVTCVVEALARVAVPLARVRPVLVLDGPHVQIPRRAGLAVDHLLSEADWSRRHDRPYAEYLSRAVGAMRRDYCTNHLVRLPEIDCPDDAELRRLLTVTPQGGIQRKVSTILARLEIAWDPA